MAWWQGLVSGLGFEVRNPIPPKIRHLCPQNVTSRVRYLKPAIHFTVKLVFWNSRRKKPSKSMEISQMACDESAASEIPREEAPPPRLTNPSCSSLPVCVEITLLDTTWETFCSQAYDFREFLSKSVSHYTRPIFPHHIVLDTEVCARNSAVRPLQTSPDIAISFYVTNDSGEYEERLTEICGVILRKWAPTAFRSSVSVKCYS
ncbi:hypothetical protein AVEN_207219-1 [Araneus ventricosus]|uniref:Uncharacterized protein n=1 Tax=Araneus ventricosus TaxID=182803 RepID=A0A4Y2IMD7_ARAVE|nr:hypothetical protein AVEN_207219-1 [Araneus ventricosus]